MDDGYPDSYPIDIDRGRALLTAYGAYSPGNNHTVPGDSQRILTDIAAVLAEDYPEVVFLDVAEKALNRLEQGND
jgi:hypothetical protein